jgi:hypothetical protein
MNRNNMFLVAALIAAALLIQAQVQRENRPQQPSGRFQILDLTYSSAVNNAMTRETDVFRIDTETGATWRFNSVVNRDGKLVEQWIKTDEPQAPQ